MKDFVGNELAEGDTVVFMQKGYRNLMKGTISKITQCMVFVQHRATNFGDTQTKQYCNQVVKVTQGKES